MQAAMVAVPSHLQAQVAMCLAVSDKKDAEQRVAPMSQSPNPTNPTEKKQGGPVQLKTGTEKNEMSKIEKHVLDESAG